MSEKTTICKYFLHGACNRGADCPFSHDRTAPSSMVCTHWLRGHCVFGDKCRYDHKHPEWAPRDDRAAGRGPAAPELARKPTVDRLEEVLPISQLRLGGQVAHLTPEAVVPPLAEERLSPPPVDLPADPFGAGEGGDVTEHDAAIAALSLSEVAAELRQHSPPEHEAQARAQWLGGGGGQYSGGAYAQEYDNSGEAAGGEGYYGHGHSGYYPEHGYHGGEYGGYSSSPSHLPAWHVPGAAGSHDDSDWGAGGVDPGRFYATPALRSLCYEYFSGGVCRAGEGCQLVHGDFCETCQHYALHPHDAAARTAHFVECSARHARLEARARSAHVECAICLERVLEKAHPSERKFGLLACDHAFCLPCIRNWRQHVTGGADVESALRTCPLCRTPAHFITPSSLWPGTPEEKEAVVGGYRAKLASIDCRNFAFGEGACPFGTSCMYRHAYADGRLEEVALRRVAADEGEVRVVQPVRLSDFIVIQQGRPRGRRR